MYCPYCHGACEKSDHFCHHCGALLNAPQPEKKGRHWVPVLIMALLCIFCTGLFFALPVNHVSYPGGMISSESPWFSLVDGVLYFDAARYTGTNQLTVPDAIGTEKVVAIGEGCFENCTEFTEIILPESLSAIGEDAFRGCTSLRGIDIPDSVAVIGKGAFYGCTALEAICVSDQVQIIGSQAFGSCRKLHYIYFLGDFQAWTGLYEELITPDTVIFCDDGSYYQGGTPY